MDAITITSIIVAVLLFADLIYYIFIHVKVNKLERVLNNIITTHEGEDEYLEEKFKEGKLQRFLMENLKED